MAAECVEDDKVVVSVRPPSSRCYATIVNVALLCNGLNIVCISLVCINLVI